MSGSTRSLVVATREAKEATMMIRTLLLLFLAGVCNSAPTSASSTSFPRRLPDQEVGSPSELAWQAWLLMNTETGAHSDTDSSSIQRRITPKSVFIAPLRNNCPDGYSEDDKGGCSRDITHLTYLEFFQKKINSQYPILNTDNKNSPLPKVTGPLQVNIPIASADSQDSKTRGDDVKPLPLKILGNYRPMDKKEDSVTVYDVVNDTKHEKEEPFFLGSSAKDTTATKATGIVVPVAEFVDDANDTFLDVMDYKIRTETEVRTNGTESNKDIKLIKIGGSRNSTNLTLPILVLTLSPTKLPQVVSTDNVKDLRVAQDAGYVFVKPEKVSVNSSVKDTVSVTVPDALLSLPSTSGSHTLDASNEEDEDVLDSMGIPEEDSTEVDGEILKHGEAGITLDQQMYRKPEDLNAKKILQDAVDPDRLLTRNHTQPQRGSESSASERDEISSNVSSEVSIKGDFIVETTLLGVNTNSSRTSDIRNRTCDTGDCDDFRELLEAEKELISEPEVVLSPQDSHGTVSTNVHGQKRAEHLLPNSPSRIKNTGPFLTGSHMSPGQSEALLYDSRPQDPYPEGDPVPEIHTIDEQASYNRESLVLPEVNEPNYFGRPNADDSYGFRINPVGYRTNQDYVRFPNHQEPQPHPARTSGYVRFPSEEANSIHAQDYKNRSPHSEDLSQSSTSTKSSVPIHQKQYSWWLPSGWRTDRQRDIQHPSQYQNQREKQHRILLGFWSKMPLLRDPSLYSSPSPTSGSYSEPTRSHQMRYSHPLPHRTSYYKEMSNQDANRIFRQKSRAPVVG